MEFTHTVGSNVSLTKTFNPASQDSNVMIDLEDEDEVKDSKYVQKKNAGK